MGILDDAIREHLELKRKHGVPEDEIERQEEEALGPARREVAQQHDDGEPEVADGVAEDEAISEAPAADQETVLFDMEDAASDESTPVEPPPVEPAPADEAEPDEAFEHDEELEPEEGELEPDEDELLSAEEEAAAEGGDADVLEDTPDFLQETPEHDRLWFEQKPPRDFDFD
jgi:hypothetical protein